MAPLKYCPTCAIKNKKTKLVLRQINFRLAVYLCGDEACPYPAERGFLEVEQRPLNELSKGNVQQLTEDVDLDNWLEDYFAGDSRKQDVNVRNDEVINGEDLSKIIDEITTSQNESDLDLQYDKDLFTWFDDAFDQFHLDDTSTNRKNNKEENQSDNIEEIVTCQVDNNLNTQLIRLNQDSNRNIAEKISEIGMKQQKELPGTNKDVPTTTKYHILNFEQFGGRVGNGSGSSLRNENTKDINTNLYKPLKHSNTKLSKPVRQQKTASHGRKNQIAQKPSLIPNYKVSKITSVQSKKFADCIYTDVIIKAADK